MVTDNQTNAVFLAEGLSHYMHMCINLLNALENEGFPTFALPRTELEHHVWAVITCRLTRYRCVSAVQILPGLPSELLILYSRVLED